MSDAIEKGASGGVYYFSFFYVSDLSSFDGFSACYPIF